MIQLKNHMKRVYDKDVTQKNMKEKFVQSINHGVETGQLIRTSLGKISLSLEINIAKNSYRIDKHAKDWKKLYCFIYLQSVVWPRSDIKCYFWSMIIIWSNRQFMM